MKEQIRYAHFSKWYPCKWFMDYMHTAVKEYTVNMQGGYLVKLDLGNYYEQED